MKHHVPFLDTNAMPWEVGEMPGLFSKMLNANPATGERTALQCIDPARGYKAPTQAHYHPDMDEELYVLKGKMSFDSENWLGANSYCYHPAFTVHGFKSAVASECWFLSRVNAPLTFGFVEEPKAVQPYSLMDLEEERAVCVLRDAREGEWADVCDDSGKVVLRRRVLSRRPSTGEGAMLVEFLPGWTSTRGDHFHSAYEEAFVLSGELAAADGTVFKAGCYSFKPPRTVQSTLKSPNGAMVYINFGGPLDFIPAARLHDTKLAS